MNGLAKYTKAVMAAVIAGLSALQVAQADNVVTQNEWVTVAVAFLTALGVVWGVPNVDRAGRNLSQPTSSVAYTVTDAESTP